MGSCAEFFEDGVSGWKEKLHALGRLGVGPATPDGGIDLP
jgi:hypothetical protein